MIIRFKIVLFSLSLCVQFVSHLHWLAMTVCFHYAYRTIYIYIFIYQNPTSISVLKVLLKLVSKISFAKLGMHILIPTRKLYIQFGVVAFKWRIFFSKFQMYLFQNVVIAEIIITKITSGIFCCFNKLIGVRLVLG
jgi:hypothetical protein